MAGKTIGFLEKLSHKRAMHRWARAARNAATTDLGELRSLRGAARLLRSHLDRVIHTADERLALPAIGNSTFPRPHNSDWAWRPELWRGSLPNPGGSSVQTKTMMGSELTLFHDCTLSELTLRQIRNQRERDIAPYGLRMDVFKFDGSFLSLVIDLPPEAVQGLRKTHLVGMNAIVEMEKPLEIFGRLNIKHGPNTEQIVRELPLNDQDVTVEFDLAYSKLNEKRIEKAWVDVIFEGPQMNEIVLRDLTFSRRPRAAL